MSTTLLYQMFGIRGYEYRRTDYHQGAASFVIEQPREKYRCSECGSAAVHAHGHNERFFRSLPICGKATEALVPFWKRLRAAHAKVRAVATDMSKAYIRAIREHLPRAIHVFDHFHVIKLYNDKLSAFRRELYRELTDVHARKLLKGTL